MYMRIILPIIYLFMYTSSIDYTCTFTHVTYSDTHTLIYRLHIPSRHALYTYRSLLKTTRIPSHALCIDHFDTRHRSQS